MFGGTPKRGDVVVFRWPGDRSQAWVKRVVGLPGDRIQMRQGQLFINDHAAALKPDGIGEAEDDNGGSEPAYRYIETLPGGVSHAIFKMRDNGRLDNTPEVTVPPDRLFVMGDNRDNSADSRVPRARRRRRIAADGQSGRPRRRRGRLLGSRHPQPAGMDLAVRFPRLAVFHRRCVERLRLPRHDVRNPVNETIADELSTPCAAGCVDRLRLPGANRLE